MSFAAVGRIAGTLFAGRGVCPSRSDIIIGILGANEKSNSEQMLEFVLNAGIPPPSYRDLLYSVRVCITHHSKKDLFQRPLYRNPPGQKSYFQIPLLKANITKLVKNVNNLIATGQFGRLFAVVYFTSRQWKVTNEDLITIDYSLEAKCGERIRLEKVLLVGSENFTLVGKPLLGKNLVRVEATVIEKTESQPKVIMKFWRRHGYQRKKWMTSPQTVLMINTIELAPALL